MIFVEFVRFVFKKKRYSKRTGESPPYHITTFDGPMPHSRLYRSAPVAEKQ